MSFLHIFYADFLHYSIILLICQYVFKKCAQLGIIGLDMHHRKPSSWQKRKQEVAKMTVFKIILFIIMLLIAICFAALFTLRRARRINESALIFKTIASICFILLGFVSYWSSDGVTSIMVLPGLVMGLIGDIYLDMKYVYPESDAMYTFVGFGAFILGHIFYLIFLLSQYGTLGTALIISIIIGVLAGIVIFLTPKLLDLDYGKFRFISAFYAALLVFVTMYSAMVCFSHFTAARFLFFIGLLLFLISDLILSQIYFGHNKNTPKNSILNHSSYYLAQILIAASIFFI